MGGSDQWGNMTAGIELIRKMDINALSGHKSYTNALTCPLLTKADGSKFGKSESGNIWLDANMTSPFEFFQFWYQHSDSDAERFLKFFTFVPMSQIPDMVENQKKNPTMKYMQHKLAEQVTLLVHGRKGLDEAIAATDFLYNDDGGIEKIAKMTVEQFKRIFATVPSTTILKSEFDESDIFDVLSNKSGNKIFSSKGDVRRTILNGGLYINKQKLTKATKDVQLIQDRFWIIQKGKKNFNILEIV
jgi:tyrosyl-tRNA synthetase